MADRQVLNNGDSLGVIRGKVNANFLEYNEKKIEATDVLTRGNTNPFSPTNPYEPATKLYVDNRFTDWEASYDPGSIRGNVFDRSNHIGQMGAAYIIQDLNNRLVSDTEKGVWNNAEPAIGAKGTAFNKNFGTTSGTVSEGNHNHVTAYEAKNVNIQNHIATVTGNPHNVTKTEVGLSDVENTADLAKPISTLTQAAIDLKADVTALSSKRDLSDSVFGDNFGNYSEFEADGHLFFNGAATVTEDDNMDPLTLTGGATAPTAINFSTTTVKIASFVNAAVDSVSSHKEIPHSSKFGATISFHFHWYPTTTNTGVARFGLEYFFSQDGVAPTFPAIIYAEQAGGGTAWAKQNLAFADLTPPSELGCQLHFRFFRDGTHGNDTFTGDSAVSTIGYHYESDGCGSREIAVK